MLGRSTSGAARLVLTAIAEVVVDIFIAGPTAFHWVFTDPQCAYLRNGLYTTRFGIAEPGTVLHNYDDCAAAKSSY